MNDTILKARGVTRTYKSKFSSVEVLRGVDIEIQSGEMIAIMGQSGVGKSTLLNILGMLDRPTSGELHLRLGESEMVDVAQISKRKRAEIRNQHIGFVFQFFHLLPDLSVRDNVLLPAMIRYGTNHYNARREKLEAHARELLDQVKVIDRERHKPSQLSGGERQRTAIARALMNTPSLVLCDEPTGNLDMETSNQIHELFQELNSTIGTTFLIVTHDSSLAAQAQRTLTMVDGRFTPSALQDA